MRKKNNGRLAEGVLKRHTSRFGKDANPAESLDFSEVHRGQSCPRHYPYPDETPWPLGVAMDIEDVAELFGCSVWTVRQKYVPQGLPYVRTSTTGRFVFFREQVLQWILQRQGKEEWK